MSYSGKCMNCGRTRELENLDILGKPYRSVCSECYEKATTGAGLVMSSTGSMGWTTKKDEAKRQRERRQRKIKEVYEEAGEDPDLQAALLSAYEMTTAVRKPHRKPVTEEPSRRTRKFSI